MAAALTLLLAPLVLGAEAHALPLAILGLLPPVAQAVAVGIVLAQLARAPSWTGAPLRGLFVLLGVATFASGTALGFLLFNCAELADTASGLALPFSVLGLPLLVGGAMIHCRAGAGPAGEPASGLGRTAGTATALVGITLLFVAFAMALPSPWQRWLVGGVNALALVCTASALRLPMLHVPAQGFLVLLVHAGRRAPWT